MTELAKTFDPAAIEARWYAHWEATGQFRPDRPGAEPWTIVNPPPNVTGSLHIGHALDNTLQDILTRHARLKGKDALWVVGTDHAGIATQMVVERQLALRQQKRTDFTRDEFVAKVWEWKAESGGEITRQLRRLGCSMDWANERFTMDEGFSKAVLKVFVDLYNEGLLYRDKRLVNWDPGLGTAISDLEVETREVQGKFWHLRYPLEDGSGAISVATTRPETMLADMAVAVNPADERYTALVGKRVRLPITGRLAPVVADEHADPALGSGAVKITPGHDFNDFEVGRRAGIEAREMLNMLDAQARVAQTADGLVPGDLLGLDRFEARARVVALLEEAGALERVEDRAIQTPFGDRSGVVIEPWLTDQWYVDAKTLAQPAIEAVRSGAIRVVPTTWEKTFFNWMENIQPWCVSRQLWWGHRIPAWFGPTREVLSAADADVGAAVFVAETEQAVLAKAQEYYGAGVSVFLEDGGDIRKGEVTLQRDRDVLDTWFSSALWPFATLGWPHANPPRNGEVAARSADGGGAGLGESPGATPPPPAAPVPLPVNGEDRTLHGRYPNDVLVSGFDILFFWDARMMMQGLHFMGDVPFKTLYLHGLVRAADGAKMSKSKGNTVDPLGLIDRYGADALRFFMAAIESQGRDIKMDEKRVEGYRNFATKLWNAARFCQANCIGGAATLDPPPATSAVDKWIVGECVKAIQAVDLALAEYRFDAAANAIYQFVWSQFCDWYLELIKGVLSPLPLAGGAGGGLDLDDAPGNLPTPNPSRKREGDETRGVAAWVLDQILVVLHPFMPFITEELWHSLAEREHDLIVAKWPMPDARAIDPEATAEVEWVISVISEIRSNRTELNISPAVTLPMTISLGTSLRSMGRWRRNRQIIERLARVKFDDVRPLPEQLSSSESDWNDIAGQFLTVLQTGSVSVIAPGFQAFGRLEGLIDMEAERTRLAKAIAAAEKERDALAARLNNPSFVERAKPEAVDKARADHSDKAAEAERLTAALSRLG